MQPVHHYRSRCGSTYRVRTLAANQEQPSRVLQARCSRHASEFGPEYPTHPTEVDRLLSTGFFAEIIPELPRKDTGWCKRSVVVLALT